MSSKELTAKANRTLMCWYSIGCNRRKPSATASSEVSRRRFPDLRPLNQNPFRRSADGGSAERHQFCPFHKLPKNWIFPGASLKYLPKNHYAVASWLPRNQPSRLTLWKLSIECRQVASIQSSAGHEGGKR